MTARLDPFAAAPAQMKGWMGISLAASSSLDPVLVSLIEVRASQINGCANCLNMHTALARERGETKLFEKVGLTFVRAGFINGLPGFVTREGDGELQTTALEIEDGKIVAIYIVRNPDKLRHLH